MVYKKSMCEELLTFFSIDVIQEVNGIFNHTVAYIAVVSGKIKQKNRHFSFFSVCFRQTNWHLVHYLLLTLLVELKESFS